MGVAFTVGQQLRGWLATYHITAALRCSDEQKVIIKTAVHPHYFENERAILTHFAGRLSIRQLLDEIPEPTPALVLGHLDDDLLQASNRKLLNRRELKYVAKRMLQGIEFLHSEGITHTDVKPDNVLVNFRDGDQSENRYTDVVLTDFGCSTQIAPDDMSYEYGGGIGAGVFRSPEANLDMRWNLPTDIWSFGTSLIYMIWGDDYCIFRPRCKKVGDEVYEREILLNQLDLFGPIEKEFMEITDDRSMEYLLGALQTLEKREERKRFAWVTDKELGPGDKELIMRIMKLDPRARPTATELLQDPWFETVP